VEKAWKARTQGKDEKHIRDCLQACNRKGEGVNGQLSDPIPTGKWSETWMPIEPSTITFYFGHSQTAKKKEGVLE